MCYNRTLGGGKGPGMCSTIEEEARIFRAVFIHLSVGTKQELARLFQISALAGVLCLAAPGMPRGDQEAELPMPQEDVQTQG